VATFETLKQRLIELDRVNGITPVEVLELPEGLHVAVRKMLKRPMTLRSTCSHMCKIIPLHSFQRGMERPILSANSAVLLATAGHPTALIDVEMASPLAQLFLGLQDSEPICTSNGYLPGIHDGGRQFLMPSSVDPGEIAPMIRRDFDVDPLNRAPERLMAANVHPGRCR
jgi:hypothetical protein